MNHNNLPKKTEDDAAEDKDKDVIKEKDIGEVRHDEPVTAKGIARSLFMANEPEQRMEVDESENQTDPSSDD